MFGGRGVGVMATRLQTIYTCSFKNITHAWQLQCIESSSAPREGPVPLHPSSMSSLVHGAESYYSYLSTTTTTE